MKTTSSYIFSFFLSFVLLVSCASLQKENLVVPPIVKEKPSSLPSNIQVSKHSPNPESYFHTILGLQYEQLRRMGSLVENDKNALKEYLIALRYDPDAFFLFKRIAVLYSRLGNQKDALFYAKKAQLLEPDHAELLSLLGDIHVITGEREQGLRYYEQVLQAAPKQAGVYFKIAGIYAEEGNLTKAEEVIYKGIEVGSSSQLSYYYLGMIAVEKRDLDTALEHFREALLRDPYFELGHLGIANIHERQGDIKSAANVYRHIVNRINPRSHQAVNRLVKLLVREREIDEALALLTRLNRTDPSNLDLSLQLSRVFVEKRDFSAAINALQPVILAKPNETRLRVYLATLYEENNEIEKALEAYQAVIKLSPSEYEVRMRLGSLYLYKLDQPLKALAQAEFAKKINPKRPESYLFTGLIHHEAKRYQDAADVLSIGIEKNPEVPDLHFHLGASFDKLNRFDDMVHAMEQAIQLAPKYANALNYLGYTFADKGIRLDEAINLIQRALDIRPDEGYFIDSLGWAHYRKGNLDDALKLLKKAASLIPSDPVIHEHLGEIYLKSNQIDLAKSSWERSLELDPSNDLLISRFTQAGFGSPALSNSVQKLQAEHQDVH